VESYRTYHAVFNRTGQADGPARSAAHQQLLRDGCNRAFFAASAVVFRDGALASA
jgi:hypothetical protein